ncbi:MAG: hypothetical protein ACE5GN_06965 [Waddliaceae bacterium]
MRGGEFELQADFIHAAKPGWKTHLSAADVIEFAKMELASFANNKAEAAALLQNKVPGSFILCYEEEGSDTLVLVQKGFRGDIIEGKQVLVNAKPVAIIGERTTASEAFLQGSFVASHL